MGKGRNKVYTDIGDELLRLAEGFRILRAYMFGAGIDQETAEKLLKDVYMESLQDSEKCYKDGDEFAKNATKGLTKTILKIQ